MLHLGSAWHMVRLKYTWDTSYLYGPTPGVTSCFKVIWPHGFDNVLPVNDSTFLNVHCLPSYVLRGIKLVFTHVNLDSDIVNRSDTLAVSWEIPVGTIDYRQGVSNDDTGGNFFVVVWAHNFDTNDPFLWLGRLDMMGRLKKVFRPDSFAERVSQSRDNQRIFCDVYSNDGYTLALDYVSDSGNYQVCYTYDSAHQLLEAYNSSTEWLGNTANYVFDGLQSGFFNFIPNPDSKGLTILNSFKDENGYRQVYIEHTDGDGNRKGGLVLLNARSYPSLLQNQIRYIDEHHLLVTFHTRRWGSALHSISIPVSAFSAVEDRAQPTAASIQAHPYPTAELLYIGLDRQDIADVLIYDVAGRQVTKVDEAEWQRGEISMRHLPSGIYYLTIRYRQGSILSKTLHSPMR